MITNSNDTRQTILSERSKRKGQLFGALDDHLKIDRIQVQIDAVAVDHFDLLGFGDFGEMFLHFQRFVFFVVGDAEDARQRFVRIVSLGEDDETRHVRHGEGLAVDLVSQFQHVGHALSVDEPKSCRDRRGKRGTIVGERQRRVTGDVVELRGVRSAGDTAEKSKRLRIARVGASVLSLRVAMLTRFARFRWQWNRHGDRFMELSSARFNRHHGTDVHARTEGTLNRRRWNRQNV